jgi:hypothetical protein
MISSSTASFRPAGLVDFDGFMARTIAASLLLSMSRVKFPGR